MSQGIEKFGFQVVREFLDGLADHSVLVDQGFAGSHGMFWGDGQIGERGSAPLVQDCMNVP